VSAVDNSISILFSEDFSYKQQAGDCANLAAWGYKTSITVKNTTGSDIASAIVSIDMLDAVLVSGETYRVMVQI